MKVRLAEYLETKNILILGFGQEGSSTYRLIRKLFPDLRIGIADQRSDLLTSFPYLSEDQYVDLYPGINYTDQLGHYNLIMKSPGIPLTEIPEKYHALIESQASLFIRCYREQITGITGTKGKSTTTTLLWNILRQKNEDVILVGNMGIPPFDIVDQITPDSNIVYELSSHQLEKLRVAPQYCILLNIFEEHLDHYIDYEAYQEAKLNITRYQQKNDYLVYCSDNLLVNQMVQEFTRNRNCYPYSQISIPQQGCYSLDEKIMWNDGEGKAELVITLDDKLMLKGRHNVMNIMAAVSIAKLKGLSNELIINGITTYTPLPHRLEFAGTFHGIHFYNDSIATIPEATIAALKALNGVDTLILGGKDRGINYQELLNSQVIKNIRHLIFMGEAGKRMFEEYRQKSTGNQEYFIGENFGEVVDWAIKNTAAGKICLLSPAAASYDWFTNFEERGAEYKRLVSKK